MLAAGPVELQNCDELNPELDYFCDVYIMHCMICACIFLNSVCVYK